PRGGGGHTWKGSPPGAGTRRCGGGARRRRPGARGGGAVRSRVTSVATRVARLDWEAIARDLDTCGFAVTPPLLTAVECRQVASLWERRGRLPPPVDMAPHPFGVGGDCLFREPPPPPPPPPRPPQLSPPAAAPALTSAHARRRR